MGTGGQPPPPQCQELLTWEEIRGNWSAGLYVISACLFQKDLAGCGYWMGWRGVDWRQSCLDTAAVIQRWRKDDRRERGRRAQFSAEEKLEQGKPGALEGGETA